MDSSELRTLRQLDSEILFQPLIDFTLLDNSSLPTPVVTEKKTSNTTNTTNSTNTKTDVKTDVKKDDVKDSSNSVSALSRLLKFESGLSREDKLQKGTLLTRKYDNFQEILFLSSDNFLLSHLWGWLNYTGPVFCFSLRVESFNILTGHFELLGSKFYDEDFLHSVIVKKESGFGLTIPQLRGSSRLFRIKITLNHLPSITYIEGLQKASFDFEFGCSTLKIKNTNPDYVNDIYESEFSKLTEQFNFSMEKGRVHDVERLVKKGCLLYTSPSPRD